MKFPWRKKEDNPEPILANDDLGAQDPYPQQQTFNRPFMEPFSSQNTEMQLILSKLELINTKIQQIEIRLQQLERKIDTIEKIAIESQEPPKRW